MTCFHSPWSERNMILWNFNKGGVFGKVRNSQLEMDDSSGAQSRSEAEASQSSSIPSWPLRHLEEWRGKLGSQRGKGGTANFEKMEGW